MTRPVDAATRYAGLVAIEHGVATAKKAASEELRHAATENGFTKGEVATPFGPVTLAENRGGTVVVIADEKAFLQWALENHADGVETVTRVRPGDRDAILADRFAAVAGEVVDTKTGELVPFARVSVVPPSPPTPSYRASDVQRAAKKAAVEWAAAGADGLVGNVRERLAIEGPT